MFDKSMANNNEGYNITPLLLLYNFLSMQGRYLLFDVGISIIIALLKMAITILFIYAKYYQQAIIYFLRVAGGKHLIISASADGGPRSRVCARETLHLAPHRQ